MAEPTPVAIMLSGNGSNLDALARYAAACPAYRIVGVLSDKADAYGLQRARDLGLPVAHCPRHAGMTPDMHERNLVETLAHWSPSLVVLAGYMRILGTTVVQAYRGRMVNVHPSLLPKYRGLHTYRRVLEAADPEHGASVHFVTEQLDGGPVIAQARVTISPGETEQTLRAKVQAMEHNLYPRVVHALCTGAVCLDNRQRVRWQGEPLAQPLDATALAEALA